MAMTDFAALTTHKKKVWVADLYRELVDRSTILRMASTSSDSVVQKVTELTKTTKGDRAIITMVPELQEDGVMGDVNPDGYEETAKAYDKELIIDQLSHAIRSQGRMAEQRAVVRFRETSRDLLANWLAQRMDETAFLTLGGIPFSLRSNGALRPTRAAGLNLTDLAFASTVTAPSANRHLRWDSASGTLQPGDTPAVTAADTPTYNMLVEARAYMRNKKIRRARLDGVGDTYHVFMSTSALAKLKLDPDFRQAVLSAGARGPSNPAFSGAIPTVDGLMIHEMEHVFDTTGATAGTSTNAGQPGFKWGANADVDGSRTLICGAQALAVAQLGEPAWDEDPGFYNRNPGIATSVIYGLLKPVFYSSVDGADEDFGVLALDHAI